MGSSGKKYEGLLHMKTFSRREFLKWKGISLAGLALLPRAQIQSIQDFPAAERLGRVTETVVNVKSLADYDSRTVKTISQDTVVACMTERTGSHPYRINQRWVETPDGYIYSPALQPVNNLPNLPIDDLPNSSLGPGMWVEVTVPWVDITLANPPPRAPWLVHSDTPRLYFSQILWVDNINKDNEDQILYRINERYGFGDQFWAPAEAFRPLTAEEIEPIRPELVEKRILVNIAQQSLSCFEDLREIYFCRVSTGVQYDELGQPSDTWATPLGSHPIWRKAVSIHMVGGTTGGGWDLSGVGWTTLFVGNGVAVHSTFWHNDFGSPRSRGCVNARPEDAKWIFRWVTPVVPYDPGDVTVSMPGGTIIEVVEE
jgi:hypothetical protein